MELDLAKTREKLNEEIRLEIFHKNEEIPLPEDTLWLVEKGMVQLAIDKEDRTKAILGWGIPKEIFW